MKKLLRRSLYIFRRDLRLADNIGLYEACQQSDEVVPCFIFDPRQIGSENPYKSLNAIQFMIESLQELSEAIERHAGHLYFFIGDPKEVLEWCVSEFELDGVFCNRDYTPFSIERDEAIAAVCANYTIPFNQYDDALLIDVESIKTGSGKPYSIFTPFYKAASKQEIQEPTSLSRFSFYTKKLKAQRFVIPQKDLFSKIGGKASDSLAVSGGSKHGAGLLKKACKMDNYLATRDIPSQDTTHLSAHFKFGTVSIRQAFYALADAGTASSNALIRQLFWRDFFTYIAYHSPHVFGHAYKREFQHIAWHNNKSWFDCWCAGETGFPLVDAGMRQLNETGFMHGRARMVTASFLVKDLHIDWRRGERYFATKLVDYDPAVNNGNWQWVASTGSDAQPYFRIFNPLLQQKKFDPDAVYIKRWVSELKHVDPDTIHNLIRKKDSVAGYPKPIIDHAEQQKITRKLYAKKYD